MITISIPYLASSGSHINSSYHYPDTSEAVKKNKEAGPWLTLFYYFLLIRSILMVCSPKTGPFKNIEFC
jgi:hypothetical protein